MGRILVPGWLSGQGMGYKPEDLWFKSRARQQKEQECGSDEVGKCEEWTGVVDGGWGWREEEYRNACLRKNGLAVWKSEL